jgi:hypothetical protein
VGELLAVIWYENALPSVPLAVVALVITGGGMAMVRVKVALPVPVLFVALSVTVELPTAVGVPEINPVVLLTESPAGKPVAP